MTAVEAPSRRCHAYAIGGCSSTLSREHYLSKAILEQIHAYPIVVLDAARSLLSRLIPLG